MSTRRALHILALILVTALTLRSQDPGLTFDRLNLEQGLSQGTVHCMLQDQNGFVWFGTQDGLNRFDGYAFTVFRYDRQDSTTISDNWINSLYEDHNGFLWVGTLSGGLNRFDRATATFVNYRFKAGDSNSLPSDNVRYVTEDHQGNLWVGTDQGLSKQTDQGFESYAFPDLSPAGTTVNSLLPDKEGTLWIGTTQGLFQFDFNSNQVVSPVLEDPLGSSDIRSILQISPQELLLGTHQGLFLLTKEESQWLSEEISFAKVTDRQVNALAMDLDGRIWIGYDQQGVVLWDKASSTDTSIRYQTDQIRSLTNDKVFDILLGKFGNIWIGTLNGISKHNISNVKFKLFQNVPGIIGHTGNSIFSIATDKKNNMWSATRNGIYRTNLVSGETTQLNAESQPALQDNSFRTVFLDNTGKIWIGSSRGSIDLLDPETLKVIPLLEVPENTPNPIYCIYETPEGAIYVGAKDGLYSYQGATKTFKHFPLAEIRSIMQDHQGLLWIGTLGEGVFNFNPRTQSFNQFRHDPNDGRSLSHDIVASLHIDEHDTIWIGTASGFNKFHQTEGVFYHFNIRDGLPGEVVYGILPDDSNHLWLSTNNGLTKYHRLHKTFRTYHSSDGLQGSEFNAGAFHQTPAGELYFGGLNGINSFFPDEIKNHPLLPKVFLTGFKVLNEEFELNQSLEYVRDIDLSYQDYFFSFEFTALHLAAPERNQYAYKMEGFDRDWIYTTRRFANYTNLDPGKYVFKVKASNNDGVWNNEELAINIYIAPPFWQAWWFYAMALVLVSGVIYVLYRLRVAQIRNEEKLKTEFNRKLSEVEMTALRSQMNPHFLFNSLNSINRYIVKSDPETASGYLTKFSRLIRLILQNSKSATIPLSNELEALRLYIEMEDLRFENKFDYQIQLDSSVEADYIEVPPMMIQPYVENAIWHGLMHKEDKGQLKVTIKQQKDALICIIEDNGIGRDKARDIKTKSATKNKSMGMKITRDRLSLMNNQFQQNSLVQVQDLKDSSDRATGTKVTLSIPIEVEEWDTEEHVNN